MNNSFKPIKPKKNKPLQDFKVVFDLNGNLKQYTYVYNTDKEEQNYIFSDHLEYDGYFPASGGNSHIYMKSLKTGRRYHMFMSDFDQILQEKRLQDNQVVGLFCFCRKGRVQGIRLVHDTP